MGITGSTVSWEFGISEQLERTVKITDYDNITSWEVFGLGYWIGKKHLDGWMGQFYRLQALHTDVGHE